MRMTKVLLFDLDDTLFNEIEFHKSAIKNTSKLIAKKLNIESDTIYKKLEYYIKSKLTHIYQLLFSELNHQWTDDFLNEIIKSHREHYPKIALSSNTLEILESLSKKYRLGLITDGYKKTQENKIAALKIKPWFEFIWINDENNVINWKPSQFSFIQANKYFDVDYFDMVYIGDNIAKDFKAPNELGMLSIHVTNIDGIYYNAKSKGKIFDAKYEISNIGELEKQLKSIWD